MEAGLPLIINFVLVINLNFEIMNVLRNSVRLIGHLGDDPKVRKLDSGKTVANFTIATNEIYRDQKGEKQSETTWHRLGGLGKTS